jgi:eukaryotic-like serine/threonine-protein kinase
LLTSPAMNSSSRRESLQALPDWSAVPSNSEEDRKLVNQRLAWFAAVVGAISAAFFAFTLVLGVAINPHWRAQLVHPATLMHPAAAAVFGVMWLACRKGRRSSLELNLLNVGGLVLSSLLYSLMIALAPASSFTQCLILTLIIVSTLNTHAIIVPATPRRAAWLSALASLPVPLTTYWVTSRTPTTMAGHTWAGVVAASFVAMWCLSGAATSVLASRIVYGLRERVRAATELGQYTLEHKIGEGGMGTVYRARHALLRRPTAIKLLSNQRHDEAKIRRFEREVQLTASLTHPNTIAIYDFGRTPDGVFYYAMELIDGITLEDLIQHAGPQPAARIVHVLIQVCSALVEAHQVGLVHRDIKPANIMLCVRGSVPDHVKVLDFGLVKEINSQDPGTTGQDTVLGTPHFLAPEAISDPGTVSARTDLYALGGVAYELLTGRHVFEGRTVVEVCSKHLLAEPVPPSLDSRLTVPPSLERIILSCLAKAPEARPVSALVLREELLAVDLTRAWSQADAQRWWDTQAPVILAQIQAERGARTSGPGTVAIDLAHRRTAGSNALA